MRRRTEEARKGSNSLDARNESQGSDVFRRSHINLDERSWGGAIEEAPSLAASSDIDSLVGYGWPDKMPHTTDNSPVVSSLAQALANQHQAELKERARGAAAWNVRVAESHERRIVVPTRGGAPLLLGLIKACSTRG